MIDAGGETGTVIERGGNGGGGGGAGGGYGVGEYRDAPRGGASCSRRTTRCDPSGSLAMTSEPDFSAGKGLTVKIDGNAVPSSDYIYDPAIGAVKFDPAKTPSAGQTLTIAYFSACQ